LISHFWITIFAINKTDIYGIKGFIQPQLVEQSFLWKKQKTQEIPLTVQPLGSPSGNLFYLDFVYNKEQQNNLNEVTPPSEPKIESGISFHSSVLCEDDFLEPPKEDFEWPQDNSEFKKTSVYQEIWTVPQLHLKDGREKYGYDNPLVIKMVSIFDPKNFKIFVSPKQFCEILRVKPKKLYANLESENKIFNNKYKLEIISFPIDGNR